MKSFFAYILANPKTTFTGLAGLFGALGVIFTQLGSGHPDYNVIMTTVVTVFTGAGLLFAKDHNVTGGDKANAGTPSSAVNPPPATIVKALIVGFLVLAFAPGFIGHAEAATKKARTGLELPLPIPLKLPGLTSADLPSAQLDKLVTSLETITQADLAAAIAMAKSGNDANALNCYNALSALTTNLQAANSAQQQLPKVHLISSFEGVRLIALSLRAGSPFSTACAPMAEEVKTDVLTFVSQIVGGGVTLASFGL